MDNDILLRKSLNEIYSFGVYFDYLIKELKLFMHNIQATYINSNYAYSIEQIIVNIENMSKRFKIIACQIEKMI